MGAILSRTGRMKPKEKDGGSSGGSRRSSGHHVHQHQHHGGGRDQGKGGEGELGRTHSKKAKKTTASPHSTPNRKNDRLDKGGKARPPTIVIQDVNYAQQDRTTPPWQAKSANETRLNMIQDGIHSHKGHKDELAALSMVQEDMSGSINWPGNVPASPPRTSKRGSGGPDSPILGLKPLPPSRGNSRHASPTRARRSSAPSSPKYGDKRMPFRSPSSTRRLESEIDWKEDDGQMGPSTMMSPKSLERLVQKGREDGHGDDHSSEEEEEMELSNLGSSDQSSVQIRTIGSIVRWQRGNMIGAGSYGKVYMGMNSDTGELFVIKQVVFHAQGVGGVPNEGKSGNGEDVLQLEQEIALLATLQHEHIVQYFGTERNYVTNELSIFLEHMPGGSIADIVLKFGPLQEAVVKKYTREVLQGLKYLHGKGIIHRDIKGQNILVDNKGVCKLADFGASRYLQTADSAANMSFKGTPVFMSPEVIMEQRYSRKSDIWSVGCTVVQMATGNPPFSEFSNHIAALFHITSTTEPPPVPANISAEARDFVLKCFERDLSKRPFVDALLRHSFIERGASGGPSPAITAPGTPSAASPIFRAQRASNNAGTPKEGSGSGKLSFDSQDELLDDEKRYKKFKEEQLSRVKVTAHLRKTSSLQGAYGQRRLGSKLKTRSQPQYAMASLHAILNPDISSFDALDPSLTREMASARTSGLAAISSEQFGALNLGSHDDDLSPSSASQSNSGPGGRKLSSPLLQPSMLRRASLQPPPNGLVMGKGNRTESRLESDMQVTDNGVDPPSPMGKSSNSGSGSGKHRPCSDIDKMLP